VNIQQWLQSLEPYVPLFQTLITSLLLVIVFFLLRKRADALLKAFEKRIDEGSAFKIGGVEFKENSFIRKTADIKQKVEIFGNPDRFELLFKAQSDTWVKSTKAMNVPGGCLVQVSSEQLNPDGSRNIAEALAFVPGVSVRTENPGNPDGGRYLDENTS
jgi:hypothetical protein